MTDPEFEELYHLHKEMVFHLALGYLKNRVEAEDVVQQVFLKVFQKSHQFEERALIKTWIYKIAITTSLDAIKAKKRKKRFPFLFASDKEAAISEITQDNRFLPNEEIENKELLETLTKAMDKLKEPQRSVFYLSQVDGLGNIEIAGIIGKNVGAVESILQRAKINMRDQLEAFYLEYKRNN